MSYIAIISHVLLLWSCMGGTRCCAEPPLTNSSHKNTEQYDYHDHDMVPLDSPLSHDQPLPMHSKSLRNGNDNHHSINAHNNSNRNSNIQWWPWSEEQDNTDKQYDDKTTNLRCNSYTNCTSCTESSLACHWCSKDNQCHAKGSWYGCIFGDSCSNNNSSNDKADNSCHSHTNCADCTLSSSLCHFCAFDNQCHAIGSVYGCSYGVNCYSNDRCQRKAPEPITTGILDDVGVIPLVLIVSVAMGVVCCSSILYAGANALQGAYHDLVRERVPPSEAFVNHGTLFQQLQIDPVLEDNPEDVDEDHLDGSDHKQSPLVDDDDLEDDQDVDDNDDPDYDDDDDPHDEEENIQPSKSQEVDDDDEDVGIDESHDRNNPLRQPLLPVSAHPDPSRLPTRYNSSVSPSIGGGGGRTAAGRHIQCMMRTCGAWYAFTLMGAVFFMASSILLFPKVPEVNVCSDEIAWKSIIDGLTSLKVEASFEILTSVKNKNRLDIELEGIAGKFKHDGQEVGIFEIKPTTIAASSISDVLVTCTVVPDRWQALGLVADYYKGTLQFLVDVSGSVKIKGIGFSIPVKLTDILVKANKNVSQEDRHLCACPQWKDLYPTASPVLSFQEAIVDPVKTNDSWWDKEELLGRKDIQ